MADERTSLDHYMAGKRAYEAGNMEAAAEAKRRYDEAVKREAAERSTAAEMAYAGGAGTIRGAASGASVGSRILDFMQLGLPAIIAEKVLGAEDVEVPKSDPDALRRLATQATGGYSEYESPYISGQLAGTIGEFGGGAATMPIGGPVRAVAQSVVPAIASETAGQVAQRTAPEYESQARLLAALTSPLATEFLKSGARRALIGPEARLGLEGSERARSVASLEEAGVPMTTGQKTGSVPLMRLEGVEATDLATREGLTRAVMAQTGSTAPKATRSAMLERKQSLGSVFDRAEAVASEVATPDDLTNMVRVVRTFRDASEGALPDVVGDALKVIDRSIKTGKPVSGEKLAELRTRINDTIENADLQSRATAAFQAKEVLDDIIARSVSRSDPDLYRELLKAREQYRAYLTIMRARKQKGSDSKAGIISPAALDTAVQMREGQKYLLGTGSPLSDLAYAGGEVIASLPTVAADASRRIAGSGAALGALAGSSGGVQDVMLGTVLGAAAPRVTQGIVRSGPVQRGLMPPQDMLTSRLLERLSRQGGGLLSID